MHHWINHLKKNERNLIVISSGNQEFTVVQIAGLIARRIVCWIKEGERVTIGQRIGMIKFGSRVDLYLAPGYEIIVSRGEKVIAGQTILAKKRRKLIMTKNKRIPIGYYVIPNLLTTASMFTGFLGILWAISDKFYHAAVAILISCVFDGLMVKWRDSQRQVLILEFRWIHWQI